MKKMLKIAGVAFCTALSIYAVQAADNLLKSSAVGPTNGARYFIHTPEAKAGGKITFADGKATVLIKDVQGLRPEWLQVYFDPQLDEGKTYKFKFKLISDKDGSISLHYLLGKAPYTSYAATTLAIKTGENTYEWEFTPKKVNGLYDSPRSLRFFFGKVGAATLVVGDVSLEEVKK